jgi:hypothetical protein
MKTKWLFSVTICLATFQLGATSPLAAREKDLLPKDVSVDEQLPNEGLKIEQILKEVFYYVKSVSKTLLHAGKVILK